MKSKKHLCLIIIPVLLSLLSCNKIHDQDLSVIETNTTDHINSIAGASKIYAVGGLAWNSGVILEYKENSFEVTEQTKVELRKIRFSQTDSLCTAIGLNGRYYEISGNQIKRHSINQAQIARDLYYKDEGIILVGGKSYGSGYIAHYDNKKQLKESIDFPYEIRAISEFHNDLYVVGFGFVAKSKDGGYTWQKLDLKGDFFLAFEEYDDTTAFIVGQEGKILHSDNSGLTWTTSKTPKGPTINGAKLINNSLYVFCNKGIYHKYDIDTKEWTSFDIGSYDILDGVITQNQLLLVGKDGFAGLLDL